MCCNKNITQDAGSDRGRRPRCRTVPARALTTLQRLSAAWNSPGQHWLNHVNRLQGNFTFNKQKHGFPVLWELISRKPQCAVSTRIIKVVVMLQPEARGGIFRSLNCEVFTDLVGTGAWAGGLRGLHPQGVYCDSAWQDTQAARREASQARRFRIHEKN